MIRLFSCLCVFFSLMPLSLFAASIVLHSRDATAWLPQQTIQGSVTGFRTKTVLIHLDEKTFPVAVNDSIFQCSFVLHDGINKIWAESRDNKQTIVSDTIRLTLGYNPQPLIIPMATVTNEKVLLQANVVTAPWKKLHFRWSADERNPAQVKIETADDTITKVKMPEQEGIYYFHVAVSSGTDTAHFETFVIRKKHSMQAFDMNTMHAPWIDSAVIYEISPHAFVANSTYDDITAKLPEIRSLGVNTIWLQPLMQNLDKSQGYEVTDYFSLRDDLGSEAQLQKLIATAKQLSLRVLFDFVPNHTSSHYPYAQEVKVYGENSHYYNFYQHSNDGAMYSSHYHTDSSGFMYYFWDDLVNLNYANPEVQQWIVEACKYWVNKYDIDGYRFDAVWGVNARQPDFGKRLQSELKAIKPDLFFLAEDKAFGGALKKGFDAVYDWTADTGWVSQWSWQYEYDPEKTLTVFNYPNHRKRDSIMHKVMFDAKTASGLRLRFIENNDMPRFIATHTLEQTKTAAMLTFMLPGIPLIYDGQEAGIKTFPQKKKPTFITKQTIQSLDSNGLFPFYRKLIALRIMHPCLITGKTEEIKVSSQASLIAFKRWDDKETMITVVNMDSVMTTGSMNLRNLISNDVSYFTLTDVMTGEIMQYPVKEASQIIVPLGCFQARTLRLQKQE